MPIGDPRFAPRRADLTFLRRRVRPRRPDPPAASPASTSAPTSGRIDYTHRDRRTAAPAAPARPSAASGPPSSTAGPARPKIDFSRPDRRPAQPAPAQGAPSAPGGRPRIDVSRPARTGAAPGGNSLDLSEAASPDPSPAAGARRPSPPPLPTHADRRVSAGGQVLLGVAEPTVTLTRVQSGVGFATVEAVCSPEVGDLRLGALYQFASGGSSTVQHAGGNRFAPSSRRPVVIASREEYERLAIDLRQIRDIERITVYAFSEARRTLQWGGTLVLETFGHGRVELPLETLYASSVAVLVSLYNLDGELVVRAEMESIAGDVREAARAYGYDRITWRDDRTPVD